MAVGSVVLVCGLRASCAVAAGCGPADTRNPFSDGASAQAWVALGVPGPGGGDVAGAGRGGAQPQCACAEPSPSRVVSASGVGGSPGRCLDSLPRLLVLGALGLSGSQQIRLLLLLCSAVRKQ